MAITITFSTKEQTRDHLEKMAASDQRSESNFISKMIEEEWLKRHPEEAKISVEEEIARR